MIIFFKFVLNNARSLHAHIKDIQSDPNILNADVIGLAETRLTNDDRSECYNIQGYNFIRKDQAQTHYGTRPPHGVALYVRNTVAVLEIKEFSCSNLEFIAADTIGTKGHMQVVIMYKSPQCTLQQFKDVCIKELLPFLNVKQSNLVIMGDFNFDLQKGNASFLQFMEETFLCKEIVKTVTTDYRTILDLFFVKVNPDVLVKSDVLEAYWSDHNVVYAAMNLS